MTRLAGGRPDCPIEGCPNTTPTGKLMCAPCWARVPKALQREVYASWRAYQRTVKHLGQSGIEARGDARRSYQFARDAAIDAAGAP